MNHLLENQRTWARILGSVALGAAAMYVLDPDKGKRRRAIARDKAQSLLANTRHTAGVVARDTQHRVQGLRAQAQRLLKAQPAPDDLQLIERVRARMGRLVSHPHAIQVGAHQGRVTLSGPILAAEVQPLLDAVQRVWGVTSVEDGLVVHDRPDTVPSLQGDGHRLIRPESTQAWSPALRAAAVLGGTLLTLYGFRQRSLAGCALMGAGVGLTARGATNLPIAQLAGITGRHRLIDLQRAIQVAAAPADVYDMWTFANFPRFLSHVEEVHDLGDGRTRWVVGDSAGAHLEWDAAMTRSVRPQLLAWRTEPEAPVQHSGSVHFEPFDGGTRVAVKMTYSAAGAAARTLASLLGDDPRRQMNDDLARMKALIETSAPLPDGPVPPEQAQRPALH